MRLRIVRGTLRLEIEYLPENYPAMTVSMVRITDVALAAHINKELQGWTVRKCNTPGVRLTKTEPVRVADEEEECELTS